ncbi:uncharacterized protein [Antedon mediterranea]|uniref:uncharacterized protein n=1 Tax=Antedon mediterranea TaxID=105859 RepID=UPI003AF6C304
MVISSHRLGACWDNIDQSAKNTHHDVTLFTDNLFLATKELGFENRQTVFELTKNFLDDIGSQVTQPVSADLDFEVNVVKELNTTIFQALTGVDMLVVRIGTDIQDVVRVVNNLRTELGTLTLDLQRLKRECVYEVIHIEENVKVCMDIPDGRELSVPIDTETGVPDVTVFGILVGMLVPDETLDLVTRLTNAEARMLSEMEGIVNNKTKEERKAMMVEIDDWNEIINKTESELSHVIINARSKLNTFTEAYVNKVDDASPQAEMYNKLRVVVTVIIFICVITLVVLGCSGVCLGAKGYNSASIPSMRSKSSDRGSKFIVATGVCTVFFSVIFFISLSLLFFVSASVSNICEPFSDSTIFDKVFDNPEYWKDGITPMKEILQFNNASTAKSIIQACDLNQDIFTAINLKITHDLYPDINTLKYFKETRIIENAVQSAVDEIVRTDANVFLPDELPEGRPSVLGLMSFVQEVATELHSLPLKEYISALKIDADILDAAGNTNLAREIRSTATRLDDLDRHHVQPVLLMTEGLIQEIEQLEVNVDIIGDSTVTLYENLDVLLKYIVNDATPTFRKSFKSCTSRVTSYAHEYTSFTRNKMENDVGYCKPISVAYDSSIAAPCEYCHGALNVFMLSIAALSFLSVAIITLSFSLEKYLKRSPSSSSVPSDNDNEDIVLKSHNQSRNTAKRNTYVSNDAWSWTNSVIGSQEDIADTEPTYTNFNPNDFQGTWDSGVVSTCSTTNNTSPIYSI